MSLRKFRYSLGACLTLLTTTLSAGENPSPADIHQELRQLRCTVLLQNFTNQFAANPEEEQVVKLLDHADSCIAEGLLSTKLLNQYVMIPRNQLLENSLQQGYSITTLSRMHRYFGGTISLTALSANAEKHRSYLSELIDSTLTGFSPDDLEKFLQPSLRPLDELITPKSLVIVTNSAALKRSDFAILSCANIPHYHGEKLLVKKISEAPQGKNIKIQYCGSHKHLARWYNPGETCDVKVSRLFPGDSSTSECVDKSALIPLLDLNDNAITASILRKGQLQDSKLGRDLLIHYLMHGSSPQVLKTIYHANPQATFDDRPGELSILHRAFLAKISPTMLSALIELVPIELLREPFPREVYFKTKSLQGLKALDLARVRDLSDIELLILDRLASPANQ
jgi:hypothetical protein